MLSFQLGWLWAIQCAQLSGQKQGEVGYYYGLVWKRAPLTRLAQSEIPRIVYDRRGYGRRTQAPFKKSCTAPWRKKGQTVRVGQVVFVGYTLLWYRYSPLTDLQYVVHPAALQQSDTPQERQLALVITVPASSTFLSPGVERGVHTDLLLASRKRPIHDPPLDGLRDPLEPLLHPLERPLLRDSARRDVEQRLGVVRFPVPRPSRSGPRAATQDSSSPLPLPARRVVAGPAAEPLGWGLLDSLGHDRTASNLKRSSSPII